jgi:hypoxanthine phosphoribosyltransferase
MNMLELRELYPPDEIHARVRAIAAKINIRYAGEPLVMVCVLKGAFMFFADLIRHVTVEPEIDFIRVASYGNGTSSSSAVSFTKDVEISLEDKHVLLVEDIVDTGCTMDFLMRQFRARRARSVALAALVDKSERREVDVPIDFAGFSVPAGFIVGYGLDCAEKYRELPAMYIAVPGK